MLTVDVDTVLIDDASMKMACAILNRDGMAFVYKMLDNRPDKASQFIAHCNAAIKPKQTNTPVISPLNVITKTTVNNQQH